MAVASKQMEKRSLFRRIQRIMDQQVEKQQLKLMILPFRLNWAKLSADFPTAIPVRAYRR
ncbi:MULTISPECIES: hypothetical protein [unclassified Paenibacillus]|uniref:hypothetical protein n=2 Tax=Paenibacillus TaxID=44249 RepID=UPI00056B3792|nr:MULTISPECIES: hypothetical protein [unclassified Paenibacillus]OMF98966.1 hypothetical protein BK147_09110 [Paenibacillus sp. FSL R7-0337]